MIYTPNFPEVTMTSAQNITKRTKTA